MTTAAIARRRLLGAMAATPMALALPTLYAAGLRGAVVIFGFPRMSRNSAAKRSV
jgi:hypothetical protein